MSAVTRHNDLPWTSCWRRWQCGTAWSVRFRPAWPITSSCSATTSCCASRGPRSLPPTCAKRPRSSWLDGWLTRLAARLPADPPRALVHGDIAPQNLLEAGGRLTGIVDWGDAAWADPAIDFAKMPLTEIPAMLEGYTGPWGYHGDGWAARILWYHVSWALGRLTDPAPNPGERHWTAPPAARLLGLLRFFASGPPEPWASLTRG